MTSTSDLAARGGQDRRPEHETALLLPPREVDGLGLAQRLTPEGVRRVEFLRTPLGRRGYHEADVERFRARVVAEVGHFNAEKAELREAMQRQREEIQRLRDYYRRHQVNVDVTVDGRGATRTRTTVTEDAVSVQAVNVMSRAQQSADQHVAQAEEYARRLVAQAREQYEQILLSAHEQAETAAEQAHEMFTPTGTGHAPASVEQEAAEMQHLQSRVAYMRTFAEVTQVQLRSILDALGEELDDLTSLPERLRTGAVTSLAGRPARSGGEVART